MRDHAMQDFKPSDKKCYESQVCSMFEIPVCGMFEWKLPVMIRVINMCLSSVCTIFSR